MPKVNRSTIRALRGPFTVLFIIALTAACHEATPEPVTSTTTPQSAVQSASRVAPAPEIPGVQLDLALRGIPIETPQATRLDVVRARLQTKTEPLRDAQRRLLGTLADAVDADSTIDSATTEESLRRIVLAAQQTSSAVTTALNDFHAALTPEQRVRVRGSFSMRWQPAPSRTRDAMHEPGAGPASRLPMLGGGLALSVRQYAAARGRLLALGREPALPTREQHTRHRAMMNAFHGEAFDAAALGVADDYTRAARDAGEQSVQVVTALLPELTPSQRGLLSQLLREPDRWMQ